MRLTKTNVADLLPAAAEYVAWDDTLPGFGVRVHSTGRKVYLVRYRTEAGTQRKLNLGRADVLLPDEARHLARAAMAEAAQGGDPAKARKDRRDSLTVKELAAEYTAYCVNRVKPGTKANHKTNWNRNILPVIGSIRVRDLTESDVMDMHTKRGENHPVNANRCVELLKAAMNYAERRGWREKHTNPVAGIEKFKEYDRQRILLPQEIARLLEVLDGYTPQRGVWAAPWAIKLLMLTGLRKTEWTFSKWSWVDFEAGTLTLPDSKTGPRVVHLSRAVVELLRQMKGLSNCEWIVPGQLQDRPLRGLGRHWAIVRARAGLEGVRLHDLRHTVGSLGHLAGLSQRQIADLLGHRRLVTTARYTHSHDAAKRGAADVAAAAIMAHAMKEGGVATAPSPVPC